MSSVESIETSTVKLSKCPKAWEEAEEGKEALPNPENLACICGIGIFVGFYSKEDTIT